VAVAVEVVIVQVMETLREALAVVGLAVMVLLAQMVLQIQALVVAVVA
tara:strand:+ start:458 stop:601 length:144 start_codon:yes stop_codon:yes gene_type:complete